ncbi:MAG: (5-formylfuran-3-yl)methyl phosphate synthase [Candidatus Methanomethylicia archaeon]
MALKLLISVTCIEEALEALKGGADIIDVKNPLEGSLGGHYPWIVMEVRKTITNAEVSAAVGDSPYLPGLVSLACYGLTLCGVDYVKVGMYGPKNINEALKLAKASCKAVKIANEKAKVVIAGYADYREAKCLNPLTIPDVAYKANADVAMIDTKIKNGLKTLHYLGIDELREFVNRAHNYGLKAAFAGSLRLEDIEVAKEIEADIIGFRGAACKGDRINGRISSELVYELRKQLK